ncbi:metallophosphoesterase family protein [Oceaniglobus trochenteri]|uniref:metallophosphoesterase family protein n=1 Tax=Oceaniglobus trochenteri TaxID=2763260 RepID=UPI001CFFC0B9|nr:metallophosphoesterase family protein [Oceaniglobus trochenteri]
MRRIVHLSDLHFGRDRPDLLPPLIEQVNDLRPDLVAISGDLTQRARNSQFEEAAAFIDALDPPVLVVPGNHDVPLTNPFLRLFAPWRRYRRWIGRDLEPTYADDRMIVVGVNTVNPMAWQSGWFSGGDIARVASAFAGVKRRMRIVMVHHPLEHLPGERKKPMRGAETALDELARCGTDVVLSGHLHSWGADAFAERAGRFGMIQVQAGTGLSTRLRGEENDFNLLTLRHGELEVQRMVADPDTPGFTEGTLRRFGLRPGGWQVQPT